MVMQGYFLSCMCRPESDLTVEVAGEGVRTPANIASISSLSQDVALVRIQRPPDFDYRAGQYVTLVREDGLARSYSISSLPAASLLDDDHLDLHVRRVPNGAFSGWLHEEAKSGDSLLLQGPAGDCFYTETSREQPLLLAGTGTGLAPLYGILQDALRQGHTGPIWLFHGALNPRGLYLQDELHQLARSHANFHYLPCVLNAEYNAASIETGPLQEVILRHHPKLSGWRGFICGDPAIVKTLKMKFFLAGMSNREIFADAFLPTPPASNTHEPTSTS
jgi:NAD(P)H-flavin reductase